jgi:hypothetical protein
VLLATRSAFSFVDARFLESLMETDRGSGDRDGCRAELTKQKMPFILETYHGCNLNIYREWTFFFGAPTLEPGRRPIPLYSA